jgi:hypothetical protein
MKEIAVSREAVAASHLLLIIKSKAMKKQMKDPGCGCGNGNGCCTGAMVD